RLLADAGLVLPRGCRERGVRGPPAPRRTGWAQPRRDGDRAAHRPLQPDQHLRLGRRLERLPHPRPDAGSKPPRYPAARAAARPRAALPPARPRKPAAAAARAAARRAPRGGAGDALAQRPARLGRRLPRAADPVPAATHGTGHARAAGAGGRAGGLRDPPAAALLSHGDLVAAPARRPLDERALPGLRLHSTGAAHAPAVRARLQQLLGLLPVRHGQDELGTALVLRRAAGRDGARRGGPLRRLSLVPLPPPTGRPRDGGRPGRCPRSDRSARAAGLLGTDRRARRNLGRQRLLPDDDRLLFLRVHHAAARPARRLRAAAAGPRVKVVVLTSSYPRTHGDTAGRFVADAVEHVRERGIEVEVVSPATVPHYGIAYGSGVVGNLRRNPARALFLPLMLGRFRQAARRAARDADLVHA